MFHLRALEEKDVPGMLEWMHDPAVNCQFRFDAAAQTAETAAAFVRGSMTATDRHYAIADENDAYLGTVSLKHIDPVNRDAEYAICLRACAQGKGAARWATHAVLETAFCQLNLHRVYLNVLSENTRAQRLYERAGFRCEGESLAHLWLRGAWKSLKWYAILQEEFIVTAQKEAFHE